MFAIYKREMRAYFTSPIGYIFIAVFLAVNGYLFSMSTLQQGAYSSISGYFTNLILIFIILVPLLTMRSLSEERKTKTEQLLMTAPVSLPGMIIGKFLSAYTMFAVTYLVGCLNYYALYKFGDPNSAVIFGYTVSILLVGAAFVAIGIFMSGLTENQLTAAISTMLLIAGFLVIGMFNQYIPYEWLRTVLNWVSIYSRFNAFTYGLFDINAVLYYASICFVFLFLTVRVYEKRRWE